MFGPNVTAPTIWTPKRLDHNPAKNLKLLPILKSHVRLIVKSHHGSARRCHRRRRRRHCRHCRRRRRRRRRRRHCCHCCHRRRRSRRRRCCCRRHHGE